jgi:ubiquinol-cytochrome c reductase cytochrome c subunit
MKTKMTAALAALAMTGAFAQAPAGDAAKGKALFMKNMCWTCHGTVGQGGDRGSGPRIAYDPWPWEGFVQQVRRPREGMPRYDPKFTSDQDLADIYAYVVSARPGPRGKDIPLLRE